MTGARTGKNLVNASFAVTTTGVTIPVNVKAGAYIASIFNSNGTSTGITSSTFAATFRDANNTAVVQNVQTGQTVTKEQAAVITNLRISFYPSQYSGTDTTLVCQLEVGSVASNYEAYQGDTLSVSWADSAGTVYGGTLNVLTGVLTVTWAKESKTWENLTFVEDLTTVRWKRLDFTMPANSSSELRSQSLCNVALYNSDATLDATHFSIHSSGSYANVYLPINTSDNTTVEICYVLATPQTYQLDPNEIYTLHGVNNVYVNTGDVTVTYSGNYAEFSFSSPLRTYNYNNLKLFGNTYIEHGKG